MQWEAIEKCVHSIVVKVDHDYSISLSELKGLLDAKERLEEVANSGKLVGQARTTCLLAQG